MNDFCPAEVLSSGSLVSAYCVPAGGFRKDYTFVMHILNRNTVLKPIFLNIIRQLLFGHIKHNIIYGNFILSERTLLLLVAVLLLSLCVVVVSVLLVTSIIMMMMMIISIIIIISVVIIISIAVLGARCSHYGEDETKVNP